MNTAAFICCYETRIPLGGGVRRNKTKAEPGVVELQEGCITKDLKREWTEQRVRQTEKNWLDF